MSHTYSIEAIAEQISAGLKYYPGPVWLVDRDGHICFANGEGKQWACTQHHRIPDDWQESCEKVLASGLSLIMEVEEEGKHYSLTFRQSEEGKFVWIFGQDISLFKVAEGALLESTEILSLIMARAPIGAFVQDAAGQLLMVSGKLFEEMGPPPRVITDFGFLVSEEQVQRFQQAVEEAMEKGTSVATFGVEGEQGARYYECEFFTFTNDQNRVISILGLVLDRTEEYRQQQKLLQANRTLREKIYQRTRQYLTLTAAAREDFENTIQALHRLLELHSPLIGAHCLRVAEWADKIGQKMGLSDEDMVQLRAAALLHDLGKIYMHADLLLKSPFSLRPDEREQLQKHPLVSEEVLRLVRGLEDAARVVRHHHELWDGSGYPDGLQGTQIPLLSRIVAVANAYDKFYHTGYQLRDKDKELVFLRLQSRGKHLFDPEVMAVLGEVIKEAIANGEVDVEMPVRIMDILPGMVLARPVIDNRGVLILPDNTQLTARHVEKLQHIFGRDRKFCLWVRRIAS